MDQQMNQPQEKFDLYAIVELFGHSKIAGRCTEQNIAGTNMLRVDVPETDTHPAFTRFFGSAAIYAINPVDEATARFTAARLQVAPIQSWDIGEFMKKNMEVKMIDRSNEIDDLPDFPAPGHDDNDNAGIF